MGLDVYLSIVVGVNLAEHARVNDEQVEITRYNEYTGTPYTRKQNAVVLTFNDGRKYGLENAKKAGLDSFNSLRDRLEGDGYFVGKPDHRYTSDIVVGVQVDSGVWRELVKEVPTPTEEQVARAKEAIEIVGLKAEPKLYAITILSY